MTKQHFCHKFGHPAEKIKATKTRYGRVHTCTECGQTSATGSLKIRDWHDEATNDATVLNHAINSIR
jgi:hypothetical protein